MSTTFDRQKKHSCQARAGVRGSRILYMQCPKLRHSHHCQSVHWWQIDYHIFEGLLISSESCSQYRFVHGIARSCVTFQCIVLTAEPCPSSDSGIDATSRVFAQQGHSLLQLSAVRMCDMQLVPLTAGEQANQTASTRTDAHPADAKRAACTTLQDSSWKEFVIMW